MSTSHQHAPAPDYAIAGDLQRVSIVCRDCGDTEEQFVPLVEVVARILRKQCDECHAEQVSQAKTEFRLAFAEALIEFMNAGTAGRTPDEVEIICDECIEPAAVYDVRNTSISGLDGKAHVCEHCGCAGKFVLREPDDGEAYVAFRAYTPRELEGM